MISSGISRPVRQHRRARSDVNGESAASTVVAATSATTATAAPSEEVVKSEGVAKARPQRSSVVMPKPSRPSSELASPSKSVSLNAAESLRSPRRKGSKKKSRHTRFVAIADYSPPSNYGGLILKISKGDAVCVRYRNASGWWWVRGAKFVFLFCLF